MGWLDLQSCRQLANICIVGASKLGAAYIFDGALLRRSIHLLHGARRWNRKVLLRPQSWQRAWHASDRIVQAAGEN